MEGWGCREGERWEGVGLGWKEEGGGGANWGHEDHQKRGGGLGGGCWSRPRPATTMTIGVEGGGGGRGRLQRPLQGVSAYDLRKACVGGNDNDHRRREGRVEGSGGGGMKRPQLLPLWSGLDL